MRKNRITPRVNTTPFFTEDRWGNPVAVLGPEDLWGEGLEAYRLRDALEVVKRLIFAAMTSPKVFTREHLEALEALESVEEILSDLLSLEAPPGRWERK